VSTAQKLLHQRHYFILSCKADQPFSSNLHPYLGAAHSALRWATWKCKLLAISWRDKKPINLLTNCFDKPRTYASKGRNNKKRKIPQVITLYHQTLSFVNHANSYQLQYSWGHHTNKHTHVQFIHLFFLTIINSWILHHYMNKVQVSYKEFFCQLLNGLASEGGEHHQHARKGEAKGTRRTSACVLQQINKLIHISFFVHANFSPLLGNSLSL
jgi:hypothetical protein